MSVLIYYLALRLAMCSVLYNIRCRLLNFPFIVFLSGLYNNIITMEYQIDESNSKQYHIAIPIRGGSGFAGAAAAAAECVLSSSKEESGHINCPRFLF